MLVKIIGADQDAIAEVLSLLDGIEYEFVVENDEPDPRLFKLPGSGTQRQEVLLWFAMQPGPRSRDELKVETKLTDGSADPRVHELVQGGFLAETDSFATTAFGKHSRLLVLTPKAKSLIKLAPRAWFPGGKRVEI